MDSRIAMSSFRYGNPPWIFKGRALYQLHLVKSATVQPCIPKELRLVEAFGWAEKVLVNSNEACDHGRQVVGLPSQSAKFSKRIAAVPRQPKTKSSPFLNVIGRNASYSDPGNQLNVQVTGIKDQITAEDTFNINLTTFVPTLDTGKWKGPAIKMSLPSFSGLTDYKPDLIEYSCDINCRVRPVRPAKVAGASLMPMNENDQSSQIHSCNTENEAAMDNKQSLAIAAMLSKPILALEFRSMEMQVEAPLVVSNYI